MKNNLISYKEYKSLANHQSIMTHQGFGDHIICNGLIRQLQTGDDKLFVFCKQSRVTLVSHMYRDNENIVVVSYPDSQENIVAHNQSSNELCLMLGCWSNLPYQNHYDSFDVGFYKQANLDFSTRFSNFYLQRNMQKELEIMNKYGVSKSSEYIFIHEDESRGFVSDRQKIRKDLKIIENNKEDNFFHYGLLFENAKELHLMPSGIYDFVNSMTNISGKIFLHRYMRNLNPFLVAKTNHYVNHLF